MTVQYIAIDPKALDEVLKRLDEIERKIDPPREWVTLKEFAAMKGVTPRTVDSWIAKGRVKARGAGRLREVKVT